MNRKKIGQYAGSEDEAMNDMRDLQPSNPIKAMTVHSEKCIINATSTIVMCSANKDQCAGCGRLTRNELLPLVDLCTKYHHGCEFQRLITVNTRATEHK